MISPKPSTCTSARVSRAPPASCCRPERWGASSTRRASSGLCATNCGKGAATSVSTTRSNGFTVGPPKTVLPIPEHPHRTITHLSIGVSAMSYVIEPEAQVAIPVARSDDLFPVRRIYRGGRNYAAHAPEMGFDPDREPPFFFCKPDNSIVVVQQGQTVEVPYPPQTTEYHHEIELVAAIGKGGPDIPVEKA